MSFTGIPNKILICFCLIGAAVSCNRFFNSSQEKEALARVGEEYLYRADVAPLLPEGISASDSVAFVMNHINKWASEQLLLTRSKINLPEGKQREFERLIADYRADLYTKAYLEVLVQQAQDTLVTQAELREFYRSKRENFKLNEKLVQIRFVVLPPQFLNQNEVKDRLQSYAVEDQAFLDSIAVQFNKLHLNDSIWVDAARVMKEIPVLNYSNQERYLKKSQFFELRDSLGVYLGVVTNVLDINDIAPLQYIEPNIKQIIRNRRRLKRKRQLEKDILDEAIQKKEFEIYDKEE